MIMFVMIINITIIKVMIIYVTAFQPGSMKEKKQLTSF